MSKDKSLGGIENFDKIDRTGEQKKFIDFLDWVDAFPDISERRRRSYQLLRAAPGGRVADVGCGVGTAAFELAGIVGASGRVTGIDLSEAMVGEAERRAFARGISAKFHQASAAELPLEDTSLDGYRAERLYQHLAEPMVALAEARRCLVPGGRVVLIDQDWDTLIFVADDRKVSREICASFAESLVNGFVGRAFHGLLTKAGFGEVKVIGDAHASHDGSSYGLVVGLCTAAARAAGMAEDVVASWEADQRRRMAEGRFFVSMTHFIALASRP